MPSSSDTTVCPAAPTATARSGVANAAPKSGTLDAVIVVAVMPPSVVRSSSPLLVVSRQVSASAQPIDVSVSPAPNACFVHVSPASVLRRSVSAPMAYSVLASKRWTRSTLPPGIASGFQEMPASVVAYATLAASPPGDTKAMPLSGPLKTISLATAPPGVALAAVPGIAVCFAKDWPASVVRSTEPSASRR